MEGLVVLIGIFIGIFIYFIPTMCATDKKHFAGIFLLNLFLGGTGVFWVLAFVWAVSDEQVHKSVNKRNKKSRK